MKHRKTVVVLGLWHLGIVTAVGLAELGMRIIGYDTNKSKIGDLSKGKPHLYEPHLEKLLKKNLKNKNLSFTSSISSIKNARFVYLAFDTPLTEQDEVDVSILFLEAEKMSKYLCDNSIIIIASQVPVGTTEKIFTAIKKNSTAQNIEIAYIPENLRLGKAFERFFKPAMIVIGTEKEETFKEISQLFNKLNTELIKTSIKTAEFVKHAINTYLAISISYANEMGNLADLIGADFQQAANIIKLDERIGPFARINPGLGFAGGTLARDLKILQKIGKNKGYSTKLINAALAVNEWQKKWVVRKLKEVFKNNLQGKKIGILGLTYTPQTSTLRRSLAVETIYDLLREKATVYAYDPYADKNEITEKKKITTKTSIDELAKGTDVLVIMTEWDDFLKINYKKIKTLMKSPIIIDPKNFLDKQSLLLLGFHYYSIGRGEKYGNL